VGGVVSVVVQNSMITDHAVESLGLGQAREVIRDSQPASDLGHAG
jgi:hypothetical protein